MQGGLREVGDPRARSVDPQIMLGLPVDRRGLPIEIDRSMATRSTSPRSSRSAKSSETAIADGIVVAEMMSASNLARPGRGRTAVHRRIQGHHSAADRQDVGAL